MSATILPFPIVARPAPLPPVRLVDQIPTPLTPAWCEHHMPLIDAAMDLLSADDVEFARRCQLMADEDGRSMLEELAGQIERLGAYVGTVADALAMTATRIRKAMSSEHMIPVGADA